MSRQRSLTARLSLLFMAAVSTVLTVAGLLFSHLTHMHFMSLDEQMLVEKLEATQSILGQIRHREQLDRLQSPLKTLLATNPGLTLLIEDSQGQRLIAEPAPLPVPAPQATPAAPAMWDWHTTDALYRGLTRTVSLAADPNPLTVMVIANVTMHEHFFELLQHWFWAGLVFSALASALLGWVVVRRGLRPIQHVTEVAASVSAKSLKERIPTEPIPQELQQLVFSFNAMLARLDDAFMRLSNFSADIAHELRTPVSNLMTHTEVALSRKRTLNEYEDNLHSNLEELQRMSRMIDDMLFLAKADNGLIVPAREPVRLDELVERLFEYYRLLSEEHGVHLKRSGQATLQGDPLMLERALTNLLTNALRYTPKNGTIVVSLEESAKSVRLTVENPGQDIPPEHLSRLFDRFYRADSARREGTASNVGLGLALTRSIVEAHNGQIECTSQKGTTCFSLEFPRH
ncbi:two-component system heavy metal sensor histidine kinase CusS [Pseudomonas duriflava]|uniref:Sensor protein n=1 Tax=Pseudomonas duriflava TaxID=459528 RepID=A0A562Q1G7_9PSED|nr:heavy metal sensor histidine kinase [Pseudomonas duriflava]TWI50504.1 two-component system heavy metal sensor histidine kinase CusS [Pseudomonas duriflava]